ncbi:MAG: RluA family pseudouridine synthase [Lachnospiraceae bacterium]|nr:RluA family pseudouridine synthase [Lachnospiraceae bacterium]
MVDILYEDNDIIVVVKPVGTASQTERSMSPDMVSILMNYQKCNGVKNPYVGVVHRLDKPVSGIMVYGKNKNATAILSKNIAEHDWNKKYVAVFCSASFPEDSGMSQGSVIPDEAGTCCTWLPMEDYLVRDGKTNTSFICDKTHKDAKLASLNYRIIETKNVTELPSLNSHIDLTANNINFVSLAEIELITGRHHQIRVQFASRNMMLWGDTRYGSKDFKKTSVALCSNSLSFVHPVTKKRLDFTIKPQNSIFKLFI